jgi:hypothetical protein
LHTTSTANPRENPPARVASGLTRFSLCLNPTLSGILMNKLLTALTLGMALTCGHAFAADTATPQQNKMKTCNADAKTKALKGDERKAFMSNCLSAKAEATADGKSAQQNKMKTCNAEAKTKALKGNDRKAFMSSCLKG